MKHILIISQYFYPEAFRINDIATEWIKRGYKVTVLTGIPNYPEGKFYAGYSWIKRRHETWNGIDIIRIPLIARGHNSIGMILNYISFMISGYIWNIFNKIEADLVFSFGLSPMTQATIGCTYSKKHKVPHFLYVQDLWPESVEAVTGIHNKAVIGPINYVIDKIYKEVDKIFVTSPSYVEAIVNRTVPVDLQKVIYWPQYGEEFYRPLKRQYNKEISENDSYNIAFTGNIGTAQGLDILPKTAALLKDENVKFIIVGNGRYQMEFEKQIDDLKIRDKFVLIPRVPSEQIPGILRACDAGFISFSKLSLWEKTIPAKMQSYMACGKAIIASASGETKRVIEEANCGICCQLGDANELADGIRKIIQMDNSMLGKNARHYFEENFDKKKLMDVMDSFIEQYLKI